MGFKDWNFVLTPYGERWRKDRRIFHSQTQLNATPKFQSVQTLQARLFLKKLIDRSDDLAVTVRG